MAHTPGPWAVIKPWWAKDRLQVWTKAAERVADLEICELNKNEEYEGQRLADARLIAAAPDLLKALEDLLDSVEHYTDLTDSDRDGYEFDTEEMRAARSAIAKAKGR